jgi:hypothetical protein
MANQFEEGQKADSPFSPPQPIDAPGDQGTNYARNNFSSETPGRSYYRDDIASYGRTLDNRFAASSQPLPLNEAIRQLPAQYWRVLTHPKTATFAAEEGKAAWNIIWVQLIALAIISAILAAIGSFENTSILNAIGIGNSNAAAALNALRENPLSTGFSSLIGVPISFFISTGIYFLLAKVFRGQGTFLHYAYCMLLIVAPITILNAVLALVPVLGPLVTFALDIYELVLIILMTMAVHRLSAGKATIAVLILPIVALILVSIIAGIFVAVFSGAH